MVHATWAGKRKPEKATITAGVSLPPTGEKETSSKPEAPPSPKKGYTTSTLFTRKKKRIASLRGEESSKLSGGRGIGLLLPGEEGVFRRSDREGVLLMHRTSNLIEGKEGKRGL